MEYQMATDLDSNVKLMVTELLKPENVDLKTAIQNRGTGGSMEESFMYGDPVGGADMIERLSVIEKKCGDYKEWSGGYYGWLMRRTQGELQNIAEFNSKQ